jgi:hypothetical protein
MQFLAVSLVIFAIHERRGILPEPTPEAHYSEYS